MKMEKAILDKMVLLVKSLVPDADIKIRSLSDLTDHPNPAVRELCEAAGLFERLSKGERL
jgi:hypothetical protein